MRTIASMRPIIFFTAPSRNTSLTSTRHNIVTRMTIGRSKNRVVLERIIGDIRALIPRIKNILAILEPSTFPIAISGLPWILASTDTISSGILVPSATIVSPMIAWDIPDFFATETAPSTSAFHPNVSKINHNKIDQIAMRTSIKNN